MNALDACWNNETISIVDPSAKRKVADLLPLVDSSAADVLRCFDQREYPSADTAQVTELPDPKWQIGRDAFKSSEQLSIKPSLVWTPYSMTVCVRSRIAQMLKASGDVESTWRLIRNSFVKAMRQRNLELDTSVSDDMQSNDVPTIAPLAKGIILTEEQTTRLRDSIAVTTYGMLAEAVRKFVKVPTQQEDIRITTDQEGCELAGGMHEYYHKWLETGVINNTSDKRSLWLYALHQDRTVGFVTGQPHSKYASVHGILVGNNFKGAGIGSMLLRKFEEHIPAGSTSLSAHAVYESVPFWESQGFKNIGESDTWGRCRQVSKNLIEQK